jgi:prepilin-type N-terminal cleavage/methylation domain-containing protein
VKTSHTQISNFSTARLPRRSGTSVGAWNLGFGIWDFDGPISAQRASRLKRYASAAFTLLELLVVIAIIGIIAAIAVPTLNAYRPNVLAVASRQLLDDLAWARQRAISDHTTVYVVFIPSCIQNLSATQPTGLPSSDIQHLLQGQFTSYAFYVNHQLGDQPGRPTVRYLTGWKSLPVGALIAQQKFGDGTPGTYPMYNSAYAPNVVTVNSTNICWTFDARDTLLNPDLTPQPTPASLFFPYVSFDYRGALTSPWHTDGAQSGHCVIPLTKGNITLPKDNTGALTWNPPNFNENPSGAWNDPNLHTYIVIDGPTGRAHVERAQVQ